MNGEITLTAANGDQLNGHIDSDRSVNCVGVEETDPFEVTLYVEVLSGTGRFAEARGWYFVKSSATPDSSNPGTFHETGYMLGSIDY